MSDTLAKYEEIMEENKNRAKATMKKIDDASKAAASSTLRFGPCDLPVNGPKVEQSLFAERGWICPVCGRGNSPFNKVCPCK